MIQAKHFISKFSDYLTNADRLPFISPPYQVKLEHAASEVDLCHDGNVRFGIHDARGMKFGSLSVGLWKETPRTLYVESIDSGAPYYGTQPYYGRELMRRTVLFAKDLGFNKIKTSIFLEGAASFWVGLGFRCTMPFSAKWDEAPCAKEAAAWRKKLAQDPDALWDMARTEIGKRVLQESGCGYSGVLSFEDTRQKEYVAKRLKLECKL